MSIVSPGVVLQGRYVIRRYVGEGGMGEVWQADDTRLERPVAIKVVAGSSEADIRREAQAAARLTHPNIAAVHDFGETVSADGSVAGFIVMEMLSGHSLADRLQAGPLGWSGAAPIAAQIAAGLSAAHSHGVVHQDIKPANIMLTPTGVKIVDFGVAAAHRDHGHARVAGTPAYTAPERLRHGAPDPAADIYSLGVVVHEMITGTTPRRVTTWDDLAHADLVTALPPLPRSVPEHAAAMIEAALDPMASERPSAAEFGHAFGAPGMTSGLAAAPRAGGETAPDAAPGRPAPTTVAPTSVAPLPALGKPVGHASVPTRAPQPTSYAEASPSYVGRSPGTTAAIAVVAIVVLIGAVIAIASLLHRSPSSNAAQGTATSATSNSPTPSSPPSTSASSNDVPTLLNELQQTIDDAANSGDVRRGDARDLSKQIRELSQTWQKGNVNDFLEKCQHLQDDLGSGDNQGDHGGDHGGNIDAGLAQNINALLHQMIDAASQQ